LVSAFQMDSEMCSTALEAEVDYFCRALDFTRVRQICTEALESGEAKDKEREIRVWLAVALTETGQPHEALKLIEEIDKSHTPTLLTTAVQLHTLKVIREEDESVKEKIHDLNGVLKKVAKQCRGNELLLAGRFFLYTDKVSKCTALVEKLLEKADNKHSAGLALYAWCLMRKTPLSTSQQKLISQLFKSSIQLSETRELTALFGRTKCLCTDKRYKDALTTLKACAKISPESRAVREERLLVESLRDRQNEIGDSEGEETEQKTTKGQKQTRKKRSPKTAKASSSPPGTPPKPATVSTKKIISPPSILLKRDSDDDSDNRQLLRKPGGGLDDDAEDDEDGKNSNFHIPGQDNLAGLEDRLDGLMALDGRRTSGVEAGIGLARLGISSSSATSGQHKRLNTQSDEDLDFGHNGRHSHSSNQERLSEFSPHSQPGGFAAQGTHQTNEKPGQAQSPRDRVASNSSNDKPVSSSPPGGLDSIPLFVDVEKDGNDTFEEGVFEDNGIISPRRKSIVDEQAIVATLSPLARRLTQDTGSMRRRRGSIAAMEKNSELSNFVKIAKVGEIFLKHCKRGAPHERNVKICFIPNKSKILIDWGTQHVKAKKNEMSVVLGKTTKIFHNSQAAKKVDDTLCFSIVTPSRTVDLQARNPELRTRWVTGLSLLFATQTRKTSRDGNNSLKGSSSRTQSGSQASRSRQSGNGFRGSLKVFNFGSQKS